VEGRYEELSGKTWVAKEEEVRVGRLFEKLGDECCLCLRLCLCLCLCEDHGLVFRHVSSETSLEVSIGIRFAPDTTPRYQQPA
jgi:hypothetical protein